MRGLLGLTLMILLPSAALAESPCQGDLSLASELVLVERALEAGDPVEALGITERALGSLTCLSAPVETEQLARLWQLEGVALARLERTGDAAVALRQAAAIETGDPVMVTEDIDLLEPYFEAWSSDWELGRLIIGPVSMDASIFVNGRLQNRTFAPVRAPAAHLVQVFENQELVFSRLVDAPEGDLEVLTNEPAAPRKNRRERDKSRSPLLLPSIAVGTAAIGLSAASFALNQRAGQLAAQGERTKAARAFDTHQTLAGAAGGVGALGAIGLGLSLSGTF